MKRKKRDQNAEADQQKEENLVLRVGRDATIGGGGLQRAKIKTAQGGRHAAIEQDQPEEQNEAAESKINSQCPGRRGPAAEQIPMRRKVGIKGKLVKRAERKGRARSELADCPARNEEQTGVEERLRFLDRRAGASGAKQDEGGQKKHDQTEPIGA